MVFLALNKFVKVTAVRTVDGAIRFAVELGGKTFSHFNFILTRRGEEIADLDLTPQQREWLIQRLTWHLQEGKINVISTASWPTCAGRRAGGVLI
jgi:MoaA/NifB/PqqE/SkfB family radical SAM enzyme